MARHSNTRVLNAVLDSIVLPNETVFYDVLHIHDLIRVEEKAGYFYFVTNFYYAKNIGLVWVNEPFLSGDGTTYRFSKYVVDYYIAPH